MKKINRKNNCTVHFMINEDEMKELNKRFSYTNYKTKREFYKDSIFKNRIISIDITGEFRKELRELTSCVSRNSANINKIAKVVNITGIIYKEDIENIKKSLRGELLFLVEFREKSNGSYYQSGGRLMAITNIHPIKTTLKAAIDYICNADKTVDEIYVSTHLCSRENAHKEFELTKKQYDSKTKVLAYYLIQSFAPNEVGFEEAHQVGKELCDKILEGKYEYVLATHIDKNHIHNHIIFNSIDIEEGKVYHSYYGSYMKIRNQSDKLCKEHHLSVIDLETQKEINAIKRRKFVNWYDWNEDKKGSSYKSRLQFDIDRAIKNSINWEDFLNKMKSFGYEIKQGKHIVFKSEK